MACSSFDLMFLGLSCLTFLVAVSSGLQFGSLDLQGSGGLQFGGGFNGKVGVGFNFGGGFSGVPNFLNIPGLPPNQYGQALNDMPAVQLGLFLGQLPKKELEAKIEDVPKSERDTAIEKLDEDTVKTIIKALPENEVQKLFHKTIKDILELPIRTIKKLIEGLPKAQFAVFFSFLPPDLEGYIFKGLSVGIQGGFYKGVLEVKINATSPNKQMEDVKKLEEEIEEVIKEDESEGVCELEGIDDEPDESELRCILKILENNNLEEAEEKIGKECHP